ncbi:thioredoxin family protein [Desulfovibrio cuneatus]|uniref:thioredoxin family protein n=1 Tax=Desulfovibrio cuneatus TaxID=159728 RepID=UPI00040E549F|nr:thioredoxin family protein [Desulfovibrio cuneatus]
MRVNILLLVILLLAGVTPATAATLPVPGTVTMVDLGADSCIPCKMMAPILTKLKAEYAGRAEVAFIDVWKNSGAGKEYGIRVIPTQIFYDKTGKEVKRHEGFLDEASLRQELDALLKE